MKSNIRKYLEGSLIFYFILGLSSLIFPNFVYFRNIKSFFTTIMSMFLFDFTFALIFVILSIVFIRLFEKYNLKATNVPFIFICGIATILIFNQFIKLNIISNLYSGFELKGFLTYMILGTISTIFCFNTKDEEQNFLKIINKF